MPFGLKNAGATYQRTMQKIFDDMLNKNVECFVDDLVVKSLKRKNHPQDLRMVFERLRRYQLKMNPLKCAFGLTSGKFLGFVKAVKGQVLADFLADHHLPAEWELCDELPDEDVMNVEMKPPWKIYFDEVLPYSFSLSQNCSNNVAEYRALILGLEAATDLDINQLKIYGDSQLVINQLLGDYELGSLS
ncbi:hypothetical protein LIER_00484 [Lithospermum erythrorhizon]|uniref:Reverse transcriptase domain-containing protein n=1 Tax=Lithospermum erythrorhizon TaxID=34254 RepID=A0AAV3NIA8_LITER